MFKKLLNTYEQLTDARLQRVCDNYGARTFAKVRVADVLPIEGSGISTQLYSFALKSHFDFVVVDDKVSPLFVVEFDGPQHSSREQSIRDQAKDQLCQRFELPILRIESEYLRPEYRGVDLLTWIVESWFLKRAFEEMQKSGDIPYDEPYDPVFFVRLPGHDTQFPLWLSAEPDKKINELYEQGKSRSPSSSYIAGRARDGSYHGVGWLMIDDKVGVLVRNSIRSQQFPFQAADLLGHIIPFSLYEELMGVLNGERAATTSTVIVQSLEEFHRTHRILAGASCGEFPVSLSSLVSSNSMKDT